ncbi:MAG: hypothetical protein LBE71_04615 [Dysgonamonadaceae bacterium]|jgi:hypothetical protein|nr:hypothetical protein [Dysgonamonadaceae bacterium]
MEIQEHYYFSPFEFDVNGRRHTDGTPFREIVKDFERDFRRRHPSHFACFFFSNNCTMLLLQYSCDTDGNTIYGMDLIEGVFDPETNYNIEKYSKYKVVYGIDSAYSQIDDDAYPLTLLIDDKLPDGMVVLKYLDDNQNDDTVLTPVGVDEKVLVRL